MRKLLIYLIVLQFLANIDLYADSWEWITNDDDKEPLKGAVAEIKIIENEIWLSTTTQLYKYVDGGFKSINTEPVVQELLFFNFKNLTKDIRGNLIGYNNNGFAIYDGTNWDIYGVDRVNYIQQIHSFNLTNKDSLTIVTANQKILTLWWDYELESYKMLNPRPINLKNGETSIGREGFLIDQIEEGVKLLFSTNNNIKFNLLDLSTGDYETINDNLNVNTENLKTLIPAFDGGVAYNYTYKNFDSSATIIAVDKGLEYPAFQFSVKHPSWAETQVTAVADYKSEGLFYAIGDRLYFKNAVEDKFINRPQILGEDIDNFWYIKSMTIDKNDTLWLATMSKGVFKAYVPDLLKVSSVVNSPQFGLRNIYIMNTYPNPSNSSYINIDYYIAESLGTNPNIKIFDINGRDQQINEIKVSNIIGNIYSARVDISALNYGMYYIKIGESEVSFTKFIRE